MADAAMRGFHFGFTVPYLTHHGARREAVARSSGDLGMVRVDAGTAAGAWWSALAYLAAPKIIARLPFVERPDHPAGLPVFLVAQPLAEAAARDLVLWSLSLDRWSGGSPAALGALGGEIIGNASDGVGLSLLASMPGTVDAAALRLALAEVVVVKRASPRSAAMRRDIPLRPNDIRARPPDRSSRLLPELFT